MTWRAGTQARWFSHVNALNPSSAMRQWLTDRSSLTIKLMSHSRHFRVQALRQRQGLCLADEFREIGLPRRLRVRERDVLLRCDERPAIFAHTVVPMRASAADWPFFNTLGERSLGSTLFGDPRVIRGSLQFSRLPARHPLVSRAQVATGLMLESPLYARRCLYRRKRGLLLVTELFLPAIAGLGVPNSA